MTTMLTQEESHKQLETLGTLGIAFKNLRDAHDDLVSHYEAVLALPDMDEKEKAENLFCLRNSIICDQRRYGAAIRDIRRILGDVGPQ